MFRIDKALIRPNVYKTIRFTEQLDEQLTALAHGERISFNELVLRCCEYALKNYVGDVEIPKMEKTE